MTKKTKELISDIDQKTPNYKVRKFEDFVRKEIFIPLLEMWF